MIARTWLAGAFASTVHIAATIAGAAQEALEPPAGAAAAAEWIELPAEEIRHVFVVPVEIGEERWWFGLDTGAPRSAIDPALAEKLGLTVVERAAADGKPSQRYVQNLRLRIGPIKHAVDWAFVYSFDEQFSGLMGRRFGGLIGLEFFRERVVEFDYARERVRVRDAEGFEYGGFGQAVPVVAAGYTWALMLLAAEGAESEGVPVLIDTGSNGSIEVSANAAEQLGMDVDPDPAHAAPTMTVRGPEPSVGSGLVSLRIGGYVLRGIRARVVDGPVLRSANADVMVGGEILSRFTVVFDFSRSRMFLELAEANDRAPCGVVGLGITASGPNLDRFVVNGVREGSPAAAAGFEVGDIVVSLGGTQMAELGMKGIGEALERLRPGDRLRFRVLRESVEREIDVIAR